MRNLIELVNIIDPNKVQKLEILKNPYQSDNKYSTFYRGIKDGIIKNDKDAVDYIYNNSKDLTKYKRLKHRFKEKLLNSVFFVNSNEAKYTDVQKAYYKCYKNLATINILLGKGAKRSAIAISEQTLRMAIKFEFTELVCVISRKLRTEYATFLGDKKKFKQINELFKEYNFYLEAEAMSEEFYNSLAIDMIGSRENKKELAIHARQYSQQLVHYLPSVKTYKFQFTYYLIKLLEFEINNNLENVVAICTEAYLALNSKLFSLKVQIFPFVFKAFYSYLQLCNYNAAKEMIEPCLNVLDYGSVNWFKFNEVYFVYLMRTEQVEQAEALLETILSHNRFNSQGEDTKEIWRIYEAYCHLMSSGSKNEQHKESIFRIGKFINDVPGFSKDKKGLNITILIVQILLLLKQKKYNQILDKMNGLERYSSRYLKKNNIYRCNCFVKMLLQLERSNFNSIALRRHADKYFKKLTEVPIQKSDQALELEIVPYENLWEMIHVELEKAA